ncbi:hypothetical protein RB653_002207 [Dictyostelium firmibasis]|uniref:DUF6748 domain-containing protein n=1 Tax=Dictyostelium firmibasis TaxID=79012 RepID=A0AAN7YSF3_9MYCE
MFKNSIITLIFTAISICICFGSQLPTNYYYKVTHVPIYCITTPCSQYRVHKVNTQDPEIVIENFVFPNGIEQNYFLLQEANTAIFYGTIIANRNGYNVNDFKVKRVYKQLPLGNSLTSTDKYYMFALSGIVCITTPCPSVSAILLNFDTTTNVNDVKQQYETNVNHFDSNWLFQKQFESQENRLIGVGTINSEGEAIVSSSYVRLPDPISSCPALPLLKCQSGHVVTYERDSNRCLSNPTCSNDNDTRLCILSIPVCPTGYDLVSYTSITTCPTYNCDAYFLTKTY